MIIILRMMIKMVMIFMMTVMVTMIMTKIGKITTFQIDLLSAPPVDVLPVVVSKVEKRRQRLDLRGAKLFPSN